MSHCYGFNAAALDRETLAGFAANMARMRAQEAIREGNFDPTDDDAVYRLYLAATGSISEARRAGLESRKALVREKTGAKL